MDLKKKIMLLEKNSSFKHFKLYTLVIHQLQLENKQSCDFHESYSIKNKSLQYIRSHRFFRICVKVL
jgi:hypothetical protein